MALDFSKIKGISDEVKAKLAKARNASELNDIVKAENLSDEQVKQIQGGAAPLGPGTEQCPWDGYCFGESCRTLPW